MIKTVKRELIAECDECGELVYGGVLEWQEFISELKDMEWRIRKDGDEWTHTCPECSTS